MPVAKGVVAQVWPGGTVGFATIQGAVIVQPKQNQVEVKELILRVRRFIAIRNSRIFGSSSCSSIPG